MPSNLPQVIIRVDEATREHWHAVAADKGMSMAELVRMTMLETHGAPQPSIARLLAEARRALQP